MYCMYTIHTDVRILDTRTSVGTFPFLHFCMFKTNKVKVANKKNKWLTWATLLKMLIFCADSKK